MSICAMIDVTVSSHPANVATSSTRLPGVDHDSLSTSLLGTNPISLSSWLVRSG